MKNKADQPSKKNYFQGEWILNWYITDIDLLFLCSLHNQFQKYVSYRTTPEAIAVDTFSFSWSDLTSHSFLPFSCISKCLQKNKNGNILRNNSFPELANQTILCNVEKNVKTTTGPSEKPSGKPDSHVSRMSGKTNKSSTIDVIFQENIETNDYSKDTVEIIMNS